MPTFKMAEVEGNESHAFQLLLVITHWVGYECCDCLLCMHELIRHISVYVDLSVYNVVLDVAGATLFCPNTLLCLELPHLFVQVRFYD